jgi:hypothetical protein
VSSAKLKDTSKTRQPTQHLSPAGFSQRGGLSTVLTEHLPVERKWAKYNKG